MKLAHLEGIPFSIVSVDSFCVCLFSHVSF